jgi:hypothetical protein
MMRFSLGLLAFTLTAVFVLTAESQPRRDGGDKGRPPDKKGGPPKFELGKVLPPFVRDELDLTPAQQKQLDALEREVREELSRILTEKQKRQVESARPPKGPPDEGDTNDRPPAGQAPRPSAEEDRKAQRGLIANSRLERATADGLAPEGFKLSGDVRYGYLGNSRSDLAGWGVRLQSQASPARAAAGSLSTSVTGLRAADGRWFRLRIRGLAQESFRVGDDDLLLKVEFFSNNGRNSLDHVGKKIFGQIERERKDLRDAEHPLGRETWRSYTLDFKTPFPEVDTLRLSLSFGNGQGGKARAEFWVDEFELLRINEPADYVPPPQVAKGAPPSLKSLVPLGGRWYFDPRGGDKQPPAQFDRSNDERLFYLAGRLETPFAGNMTSWLRPGFKDRSGQYVREDRFVPDSVVIQFTKTHLIMRSKNLPNHPTAVFPDRDGAIDGNPHVIREQQHTWYLPLEPKENPAHVAMNKTNSNHALPMGPTGVAVNGVVFFNPFDAGSISALSRLDRCCGHPAPGSDYHYHKYPVCVKSPWSDDGEDHSPVIGFAFDGFPIYGPYEKAGGLAKDSKVTPLNEFNIHFDEQRGWHYHVTPGRYPHIIGGYWGELESRNVLKGPKR